jgi:hypothetical protein
MIGIGDNAVHFVTKPPSVICRRAVPYSNSHICVCPQRREVYFTVKI